MDVIGKNVLRKDAWDKVTGKAKYTGDEWRPGMLHVHKVVSPYAHAIIKKMDFSRALNMKGIWKVIIGENLPLTGEEIRDRYPIAYERVRYYGETVALVIGDSPGLAKAAADSIAVIYEPLPDVKTPREALNKEAPILHERLGMYEKIPSAYPVPGTNIANVSKIRKGDMKEGWESCDVSAEEHFSFSPSDHAAMETRCSLCEIKDDGSIIITSSSQAPFMIKRLISEYFEVESGKITVNTPLVGGAYGGKASIQLEFLAYLASRAVGGRLVRVMNSREEDMITSPCHIGLDATVKIGCTKDGKLKAAELFYLWDGGAYADKAADLSRAGAVDCTGPYHIENISCDSLCMYTNHPYASPFRGFAHSEVLFAFERTMDILAKKLNMDPFDLRERNSIMPGHTTPTQVRLNKSNVGNLPACIHRLKIAMEWEKGQLIPAGDHKVIAKGISCVWKNSTIDVNAGSGVFLTFNDDASVNLISGVVEIGTGTKTVLAQIVAEILQIDIEKVHVQMGVNTKSTPQHWKTVASRGILMAGRAAEQAAKDIVAQLKQIASCVLKAPAEDFEIGGGRVYLKSEPDAGLDFKDIVNGYTFPNGNTIGGPLLGKGHYVLRGITYLDQETGEGNPGPEWEVGAQGVEVEFDTRQYTYKIRRAFSVMDAGRVLNRKMAEGQLMGAMSMGLAFSGRETFYFDDYSRVLNFQLRTYRPLRFGEEPEYICEFIEAPHGEAPFGARGMGEHGILGMPAALGNSLSLAAAVSLTRLPLIPEYIWRKKTGGRGIDFI
ncbi:CO or xanthine dehydrogenase, Mo-binding subunit [Bacillus sp. OV322]|uniref:xanthine dehydrogenase family protein molybdopterin-binding subunit n=1 Tax=Bacillus sp. OV322 TaxID=1882764 RepID=UPI0008F099F0|nr:xanthine dehydrogenase family protein molybdopterin-binding subunit [Bacillus sp. OV322]SFC67934.1 CO or xanthine dehydrogenase, Mo-binding subunit [Bacillus sp. OV322]